MPEGRVRVLSHGASPHPALRATFSRREKDLLATLFANLDSSAFLTTFHIQAVYDTLFTPMSSGTQPNTSLKGKIAIVTGSSRGAGRGIALALGDVGATVYVTGRSVRGKATTENLPGTIDETAEGVTARGGEGIAVRCDHTVDADVDALFARVQQEHGTD